MASDSLIREELSALLGAEVYAGGTLNKPLLASYLFGSPEHAKEINCIVHPLSLIHIFWFVVGIYLIPGLLKRCRKLMSEETLLIVSLRLCFGTLLFGDS